MTTRLVRTAVLAAALVALHAYGAGVAESFSPDTKVVARIDLTQLRGLPVFRDFMSQRGNPMDTFNAAIRQWSGVDLDSVTEAWIGVEGKDLGVFVLRGRFDVDLIRQTVYNIPTAQPVERPGIPYAVLLPDDKKPGAFNLAALPDAKTLVMGPPELADRYLEGYLGKLPGLPEQAAAMVEQLEDSPMLVRAVVLGLDEAELEKNPVLRHLQYAELHGQYEGGLDLDLIVGVFDARMADPLRKIAEGALSIFRNTPELQQKAGRIPSVLLRTASVRTDENTVVLTSRVEEKDLQELVAVRRGNAPRKQ